MMETFTSHQASLNRTINITAYLTIFGVAVGGVLSISQILDRWSATILLFIFGLIFSRYRIIKLEHQTRYISFLLVLQTFIITLLLQFQSASTSFALLFFILCVIVGLYYPIKWGLLWTALFFMILTISLERFSGWAFSLRFSTPYLGGFLFFYLMANAFQSLRTAQTLNEKLLVDLNKKNQQLEQYAGQVEKLTIVEERNRIAREMHDAVGHHLTIASVQLEGARRIINTQPEKTSVILATAQDQVKEALGELRKTVNKLLEPVETELTLSQAVRSLANSFYDATNINIQLEIPDSEYNIDRDQHLVFYRMAQEALTNIQRHSQANQIWISLKNNAGTITLSVKDNGIGYEHNKKEGFGIKGIRERARQVGGLFSIKSEPGQGTELILSIPIRYSQD